MYKLRDKYPWNVDVVCIPIEEFEAVVDSELFQDEPGEFFMKAVMTGVNCFYGLGGSSQMVSSWFMPVRYKAGGYLEAETSEFARSINHIDFDKILPLLPA